MACSQLLQCLHSLGFSLGHVETKPSPSQDYENMGQLGSPDEREGRVRQDTATPLVRTSPPPERREESAGPALLILQLFTFPRQPGQGAPGPEGRAGAGPGHEPRPETLGTSSPWGGGEDQAWEMRIKYKACIEYYFVLLLIVVICCFF